MRNSLTRLLGASLWLGALALPAIPAWAEESPPLLVVSHYRIVGDNPLSAAETEAIMQPLAGPKSSIQEIEADARRLESALAKRGYAFQRVIIPPQKPVDGVVQLDILKFTLGEVHVSGNRHFSDENVKASLPVLVPGISPDPRETGRVLAIVNSHPEKHVQVVMKAKPGSESIDADLQVVDRSPFSGYLQVANNGNAESGRDRLTLGLQHANLFDSDHVVNFSYTTSFSHPSDVEQYGASYWIPFYGWGSSLLLYHFKSDVNSGRIAGAFDVSGSGSFTGATFNYSLPRWGVVAPSLSLGLEDRNFDNDVQFSGTQIGNKVRSTPYSLRLQGRSENPWGMVSAYLEYVQNLPGGEHNDDAAYAASRSGATANWDAWRLGADLGGRMDGDWRLLGRLRAQHSSDALIAGEQFGVGGAWSVRGFDERAIAGDSGWFASLETITPLLLPGLRGAAFVDLGGIGFVQGTGGTRQQSQNVASAGFGIRYQGPYGLEARADLAEVLDGVPEIQKTGSWRAHMSLTSRF